MMMVVLQARAGEDPEARVARLALDRDHHAQVKKLLSMTLMEVMMMVVVLQARAQQDPEAREARLALDRDHHAEVRKLLYKYKTTQTI